MHPKPYAVTDANVRRLSLFMTGQVSDHAGAAASLADLSEAHRLVGDRGFEAY